MPSVAGYSTGVLDRGHGYVLYHSSPVKADAPFLQVRPGHFVIVGRQGKSKGDWWMGQVLFCEGGARDPKVKSLLQVADVDTGIIRWINADEVTDVMWSMDGWPV